MANLKNNFKSKNIYFLNLAFEQAKINLGSTKTNPSVGCVVEKDGAVISSGHTSLNGRPHAEFNALNKNKNFKNITLFEIVQISEVFCSLNAKTSLRNRNLILSTAPIIIAAKEPMIWKLH